MTTCNNCGNPIEFGTCICIRCAEKSKDSFYQFLDIFPYKHAVNINGMPI